MDDLIDKRSRMEEEYDYIQSLERPPKESSTEFILCIILLCVGFFGCWFFSDTKETNKTDSCEDTHLNVEFQTERG